jgi:hypothetical protein
MSCLAYEMGFLNDMIEEKTQSHQHPMPTRAEVDELLAFLPIFSVADYQPVRQWHGGPAGSTKSLFPWPEYDNAVGRFIEAASKDCWNDRYDADEVSRMLDDDTGINQASLADIRSMLTFCVRGERFCDGHVGGMIVRGHVRRILERLKAINTAYPKTQPRD